MKCIYQMSGKCQFADLLFEGGEEPAGMWGRAVGKGQEEEGLVSSCQEYKHLGMVVEDSSLQLEGR